MAQDCKIGEEELSPLIKMCTSVEEWSHHRIECLQNPVKRIRLFNLIKHHIPLQWLLIHHEPVRYQKGNQPLAD